MQTIKRETCKKYYTFLFRFRYHANTTYITRLKVRGILQLAR
jgi:hypothetical protein